MINFVELNQEEYIQLVDLKTNKSTINYSLLQEVCRLLHIKSVGKPYKTFVDRKLYSDKIEGLRKIMSRDLYGSNYTIFYIDLLRKHPKYDYYSVMCFESDQVVDFNQILKIKKLKVFI